MAFIAGLRGTGDWGADERPKDFREMILWSDPNGQAPLTALMSQMGSEKLTDPEFSWWTERNDHVRIRINNVGGYAAGATSFTVDATDEANRIAGAFACVPGDMFMVETANGVPTGEIVQVTTAPTVDTTLVVARGVAGTTAGAIADDAFLVQMGSAFSEGSGAPVSSSRNPVKEYNLAQIFKTTYEITETANLTKARTGKLLEIEKKRKSFAHARKLEMSYLFGRRHETTGSNGKPLRYTGGLVSMLTTHKKAFSSGASTDFTLDNFIDSISPVFDFDAGGAGDQRIVFAGNGALNNLNKLVKDANSTQIQYTGKIKAWGMSLFELTVPQGTIFIKSHPLFNIHPVFRYSMLGINPKGLKDRFMRQTKAKDNIQANDEDSIKGQWLTESGLEVHHEDTMFYFGDCRPH